MTGPTEMIGPDDESENPESERPESGSPEPDWVAQRRLAEIFGDVLPATTRDEREPGVDPTQGESGSDAWLRRQVPPHHGG